MGRTLVQREWSAVHAGESFVQPGQSLVQPYESLVHGGDPLVRLWEASPFTALPLPPNFG